MYKRANADETSILRKPIQSLISDTYRMYRLREFTALALLIAILMFLTLAPATATPSRHIVYVVTDPYDRQYLVKLLELSPSLRGSLAEGLRRLSEKLMNIEPRQNIVVLLDPNYRDPREARKVAKQLYDFITSGGVVIATFNGLTLLELDDRFRVVAEIRDVHVAPKLPGYNVSKYGYALLTAPGCLTEYIEDIPVYKLALGRGWLIVIPLNLVWAYSDTGNMLYVSVMVEAIKEAMELPLNKPTADIKPLIAAMIASGAALLASASGGSTSETSRVGVERREAPKLVVAPLWSRLSEEEVMSHPLRVKILEILKREGIAYFNELWRKLGVGKATVGWHLSVLKRFGFVDEVKIGNKLFYYLVDNRREALRKLASIEPIVCSILCALARGSEPMDVMYRFGLRREELQDLMKLALGFEVRFSDLPRLRGKILDVLRNTECFCILLRR